MDPVRNPFEPGAGTRPPELAGRDDIITDADIALQRVLRGRQGKCHIMLGLRGTGKTVLLNKIESLAEGHGHVTSFIEAPDDGSLAQLLYPHLVKALQKLSPIEAAKGLVNKAQCAVRSFASIFELKYGDYSISVDPEPGVADSGILEQDLIDVFLAIGHAAQAGDKAWTLFIDELQYLNKEELSALIVALHRSGQRGLPVMLFAAGLPQIAGLSGDAKSYAERLFNFRAIGPLSEPDASAAIREPIKEEGERITEAALMEIVNVTHGYPYFLQEWGFQAWNLAENSPINAETVIEASDAAIKRLDDGFFRVRFDRLTAKEREYVQAMADLGKGPYRSSDVAQKLDVKPDSLGPRRASIIHKGMIYSPSHGEIAFTVPLFDEYLKRTAI